MALQPLPNLPPFVQLRELSRKVHADACVEIETNYYSVPSEFVDKLVSIQIIGSELKIIYKDLVIAEHCLSQGIRQRVLVREHLKGIVGAHKTVILPKERQSSELLRPLEEYEAIAGGGW
jgi:hypothetical protein